MLSKKFTNFCVIALCFCSTFLLSSCGKKTHPKPPNIASYGPLNVLDPTQPLVWIDNCEPNEVITCDLEYQYISDYILNRETRSANCPINRTLSFTFDLDDCFFLQFWGWSGTVTCVGTRSVFSSVPPTTVRNVQCL